MSGDAVACQMLGSTCGGVTAVLDKHRTYWGARKWKVWRGEGHNVGLVVEHEAGSARRFFRAFGKNPEVPAAYAFEGRDFCSLQLAVDHLAELSR